MEILRTIQAYADARSLKFVVIGGHAVNAYGFSRHTGDLDLLVMKSQKEEWVKVLLKLRYSLGQDSNQFSRFKPSVIEAWPIDLMYVDDKTFTTLYDESVTFDFGLIESRVASPEHIAILKLHALKEEKPYRASKDYGDLLFLLQNRKVALTEDQLLELCKRYATIELFEQLKKDLV